jgi:hypothetical protein
VSSGIFTPDGATTFPSGWNETRVEYSADDLDNVTRLTLDGYCRIDGFTGGATITPIVGAKSGIPGTSDTVNGRFHFQVSADSAGRIIVATNPTTETINAFTSTGAYTIGVPFHWMVVWDFTLVGPAKLVLYIDGDLVAWNSISVASPADKFVPDSLPFGLIVCYVLGGRSHDGSDVQDLEIDYVRAWTGVAATSTQAAEYGGTYKADDTGTLGVPTHRFEFESDAEDTGSSPFTLEYSQNLSFGDLTHASPPPPIECVSLTFAESIEADGASWVVFATIEGCGNADGLFRFCTTVPHFGEGDPLFRAWLAAWPNILSEGAPKDDGGIVDAGEFSLSILDFGDALTSEWRTEADPETFLVNGLAPGDTSLTVLDNSGFTAAGVIYLASEAMIVDEVGGSNTLIVTRGALDTTAVAIEAGMLVYRHLPYLLSRRIRAYVASADACLESEAQEIGQYRIDQKELDDTLGVYTIRGPSQIIFANAQVSRRQPTRFKVKASYPSGKISVEPRALDQALSDIPLWFADDPRCFLRFGEEVATATNISPAGSQYPIFELRDRGVMGTPVENSEETDYIEVAFGADPEPTATGAQPTFFRYAEGPTPSDERDETWTPSAHWVDLIFNLLVSSAMPEDGLELANRVAAYGAWDCLPPGIGIGQRAATIDWVSALSVRARTPDYVFPDFVAPSQPVTFGELVTEEFLRPVGAYLTTSGGLLRIVMPRIPLVGDTSFTIGHADIVSESIGNRLYSMGVRVKQDMSEIVTSLEYELGRGTQQAVVTINDSDYDLTYGSKGYREHETRRRKVKVPSARPDTDGSVEFLKYRGMSVMARKRYPATMLEYVTPGLKYWTSTAGDVGSITHGQVPDQHLGVRGVVDLQGEIRQRTVRIEPDDVSIAHTLRTDRTNSRFGLIAPCARIVLVELAGDAGAVNVTLSENWFTEPEATEAGLPSTDASAFPIGVGLHVELRDRDGSFVRVLPLMFYNEGNEVAFVADASFDGPTEDEAGMIIAYVSHADGTTLQQETSVYLADPATRTIGGSEQRPWRYAEP